MIYERDKKCELCFENITKYTEIYKVENVYQKEYYNFYFKTKDEVHIISVPYKDFEERDIEEIEDKIFTTYVDYIICKSLFNWANKNETNI